MRTESIENYLKRIYELSEEFGCQRVSTSALSKRMDVAMPSASAMIKRLSMMEPPLVDYESHHGVLLTPAGVHAALETIRHHRLLETFLVEALGYTWDEVHEEAEKLEHYISEKLEDRIAVYLGNPEFDPHGEPIPTKDGKVPALRYISMTNIEQGERARVFRIKSDHPDILPYLSSIGIKAEVELVITDKAPLDGPISFQIIGSDNVQVIGPKAAELVLVERITDD